jgi:DNA processing protein
MFPRAKLKAMLKDILISSYTLEELLGPLNDVEKKFAPRKLYVTGKLQIPLQSPRAAVIGSRDASPEGLKAADNIARMLARHKVIVVSGLAKGIDTLAHKAAISECGHTIAVIGTPLDQVYPRSNLELQKVIIRDHLVISQFPIGYPTLPRNFIFRNRTMALIADASIIVEAGDDSGALSQGWEALRLGRPLFIRSSVMHDPSLNWPEKMARYGAVEFTDSDEIIDTLPFGERILQVAP